MKKARRIQRPVRSKVWTSRLAPDLARNAERVRKALGVTKSTMIEIALRDFCSRKGR